jgi:hypothetical protein
MISDAVESKKSLKNIRKKVEGASQEDSLDINANKALDESVKDSVSNRQLRETYAVKIFWYLVAYTGTAFLLVFFHGFRLQGFSLDTPVLGLIVGSTAVSAIGLVGIVARSLFRGNAK